MFLHNIINILFPPTCVGCRRLGEELCKKCFCQIKPILQDTCPYCFKHSQFGLTHERCKTPYCLDGAQSLLRYNSIVKKIIQRTKYSLAYQTLFSVLSQTPPYWFEPITNYISHISPQPHLLSIPLHPKRFAQRGFNQADIITNHIAKLTQLKTTRLLARTNNTPPQALVSSKQAREKNIQGAFSFTGKSKPIPPTIILIDDIYTSGSTAKEATRVLKMNGVQKVFLYTFAHGL